LGSNPGARLMAVSLSEEFLYLRESLLIGFQASLRYENGRLVRADGVQTPVVQLSGSGFVVFEIKKPLRALRAHAGCGVTVDAERVVGWTGRLLPGPSRMDSGALGLAHLVGFSGEGAVFVEVG
jgi:uncharacterized protein (AIM24 family)